MEKDLKLSDKKLIEILKTDGVGVLPSETLYGLMCQALSKKAVERVYKIRQRNPQKPCIILISKIADLKLFGVKLKEAEKKFLKKYWPGAVSVVLDCPNKNFSYLHRGTKTLAFRLPKKESLLSLLKKVGPLLAPSANPEGMPPALTIAEAKKYFDNEVDFYVNVGKLNKKASTLVRIKDREVEVLRQGSVRI